MLVTSRLYAQYVRTQDSVLATASGDVNSPGPSFWSSLPPTVERYVKTMLLIHQTGSVRVGELVRYTLTYTPARDRVRPVPHHLHVRIRNTCAIALRAAYLHGPYTLYTACYPSSFDPNSKYDADTYGEPQFEPTLKAGGSWIATLKVPEPLRRVCEEPSSSGEAPKSCTWVIEVSSQVLFSTSATVHYEVIVGRDEKSVEVGFSGLTGSINSTPGRLVDHQESKKKPNHPQGLMKGVFSNAVTVVVDDTASLWDKPQLPGLQYANFHQFDPNKYGSEGRPSAEHVGQTTGSRQERSKKKRKVHLVVITHGLHSNLGADMLYMKESIDAAAKQARIDARNRKKAHLTKAHSGPIHDYTSNCLLPSDAKTVQEPATSTAPLTGGQEDLNELEDDEEEVIVRGFSGNVVRTERGIQYLGKRLAKYVLGMTYPDQPFLPVKKSFAKKVSRTFSSRDKIEDSEGHESHHGSSVHSGAPKFPHLNRPYQVTSISFIGHSLGGLTQTYAIAYIHKHSPEFFKRIQPINFIALATPFLGLSNENPLYVKFALDFGLVGRTGQDLGLTWRAPTMVRSGWAGMIAGIGTERQRAPKKVDEGTKPLLRLLPSGPAHQALRIFRNRTVYSNVVNDGIVPLRTSCLLFLDWKGLDRVDKARRENGLFGTVAGWGWAEITGTNSTDHRNQWPWHKQAQGVGPSDFTDDDSDYPHEGAEGNEVPQPADDATKADHGGTQPEVGVKTFNEDSKGKSLQNSLPGRKLVQPVEAGDLTNSPLAGFMSLFGTGGSKKQNPAKHHIPKQKKLLRRAQTLKVGSADTTQSSEGSSPEPMPGQYQQSTRGKIASSDPSDFFGPPKTSVLESASDILNPPLPTLDFIMDPQKRPRTIFHDRVYHPADIPPPPHVRRRTTVMRKLSYGLGSGDASSRRNSKTTHDPQDDSPGVSGSEPTPMTAEIGSMPVEEKIARAYHRDLSWRKVLVRLSPDAHNNIVVRRMFANAYGWPVVKHLVDTHFADTHAALTADRYEDNVERAKPMAEPVSDEGGETNEQRRRMSGDGDDEREQMYREATDEVHELNGQEDAIGSMASSGNASKRQWSLDRQDSVGSTAWTERFFDGTDDEDDDESVEGFPHWQKDVDDDGNGNTTPKGTSEGDIKDFLHSGDMSKKQGKVPLVLPVSRTTETPPPMTPVLGLGKSIEDKINLDDKKTQSASH